MDYDLKITGGMIYDGTGAPGCIGEVAIKHDCRGRRGERQGGGDRRGEEAGAEAYPGRCTT